MIATIIIIILLAIDLGMSLAKHGEPKTGKYSFWVTLLAVAIQAYLYYAAGLFDKFAVLWQV